MKIESLQNTHVKEWCKLKEKKYRDETGLFLVEGEHLIEEAKKQNLIKEIISCEDTLDADFYVTKDIMKKIASQVSISSRIAVCYKKKEEELQNKILILDNIQDPGNFGTIIRSAVAFGFTDIVVSLDTVNLYNEKVVRASEGMLFHINVLRRELPSFLETMKSDYQVFTTDAQKGENIKEIPLQDKIAIVIGNEGQGVREEIKKYATHFIKIPMQKTCESLNAGVAASIIMYEVAVKQ